MFGFDKTKKLNKEIEKLNNEIVELNKIKRNLQEEKDRLILNNIELNDEARDLRNEIEELKSLTFESTSFENLPAHNILDILLFPFRFMLLCS